MNMDSEPLLQLQNATVKYGGLTALDDFSSAIDEGEVVAFLGPNGAGKTTALRAIFGLSPLAQGRVLWHGAPVDPVPHQMVRRGIAFVPQGRRVFGGLTVEENVEIGGFVTDDVAERRRRMD